MLFYKNIHFTGKHNLPQTLITKVGLQVSPTKKNLKALVQSSFLNNFSTYQNGL